MRKFVLFLIVIGFPFLSDANNFCTRSLSEKSTQTVSEGIASGLLKISEKNIGDLEPQEVSRIQQLVDVFGYEVFIVGSTAKGSRRSIGSDLPLAVFGGSKENTKSDIDFVVKDGLGDLANQFSFPDLDPGFGVREIFYINFSNSPAIMFRPFLNPIFLQGSGRFYLD